ncbi:Hypothetical predicted protein [Octopus vulgaris]|uniref:Uncharacterized protein n=1 Tax=Octopus vulgaris TaxID=6645 RepID=A0AA36BSH0_OCTVU|nr:Hypothetical predicted protein [Octopus vulgaris]
MPYALWSHGLCCDFKSYRVNTFTTRRTKKITIIGNFNKLIVTPGKGYPKPKRVRTYLQVKRIDHIVAAVMTFWLIFCELLILSISDTRACLNTVCIPQNSLTL